MSKVLNMRLVVLLCLTLGLAPYRPEPHIWKQIKRLGEGPMTMTGLEWFDLLMHGVPWLLLIIVLIGRMRKGT